MKSDDLIEKLKSINKDIREKNFAPFYFIYGNENYLISQVKNSIIKNFDDASKLNVKVYNNKNFYYDEVIKFIDTLPIMNDKKLIIFDNVDYFKKNKNDENDRLIKAFESSKEINVILIIENENNNKYSKNYSSSNEYIKYISASGVVLDICTLDEFSLSKTISNHFKKNDIDINKVEIAYFIRMCGNSLFNLYNEADKLIAYLGDTKKVTKEDIDEVIDHKLDDRIYVLIDLYNSNKKEEALKFYGDLLTEGEKNENIFSVFAYNYANLIVCKDYMDKGKGQKEIADLMEIESWRVKNLMNANRFVTMDTLKNKLKRITEISLLRNNGSLDKENIVLLLMN